MIEISPVSTKDGLVGPVSGVWDGKPTYRISWAGNPLVWSDLTLGPFFKVERG